MSRPTRLACARKENGGVCKFEGLVSCQMAPSRLTLKRAVTTESPMVVWGIV